MLIVTLRRAGANPVSSMRRPVAMPYRCANRLSRDEVRPAELCPRDFVVSGKPRRRFVARGSQALSVDPPIAIGGVVAREVRPEREPRGGEGFPLARVRKRRHGDELTLIESGERGV